jgi:kinesin family protein 18/19
MDPSDGASSIAVVVRVRPFTIREAAQLSKSDDGPLFLGDGSLAAVPTPKLTSKGLRSVIKVVDDKCLYACLAEISTPIADIELQQSI